MFATKLNGISILAIVFLMGALIGHLFSSPPIFTSTDFPSWGNDWKIFLCLINKSENCSQISKFPFAYFLNSILPAQVNIQESQVVLTATNIIFLAFSVFFVAYASKININNYKPIYAYIASLAFTTLPAYYINSGALELQNGVLLGVFFTSIWLIIVKKKIDLLIVISSIVSAFLLPLYKDTSIILMTLFIATALGISSKSFTSDAIIKNIGYNIKFLSLLLVAVISAFLLILTFNNFRYGSILPIPYIIEARDAAPNLFTKISNFFWIIFSPNGGLIVSWSAALLVLWKLTRLFNFNFAKYTISSVLMIVSTTSVILANWWTPFGWEGWGNRLIIPSLIGSLIFLASVVSTQDFSSKQTTSDKKILKYYSKYCILIIFFTCSLWYLAITYSSQRYNFLNYSLWGSDSCKAVAELRTQRAMWPFKKTELHLQCHLDRFKYIPGKKMDTSPLSAVEKKSYRIAKGNGAGVIGKGWSQVEDWGVWSDAEFAEIRFVKKHKIDNAIIEINPFIYGQLKSQRVIAYLDDIKVYDGTFSSPGKIDFNLNHNKINPDEIVRIKINLPDAKSPAELGLNSDKRSLGIGLLSIEFK